MRPPVVLAASEVVERLGPLVAEVSSAVSFVPVSPDRVEGDPATATIAYFSGELLPSRADAFADAVASATGLEWLQSFSAGVDHPWFQELLARGVRLTTASGAAAVPIAHTVLYYLLALSRRARRWEDAQRRRAWEPHDIVDLAGTRLCVVGLGPIGMEVVRLALAFRMDVVGVRRRPRGDELCPVVGFDELDRVLATTDHLVLAVPLTTATHHLLDTRRLALLPRHAVVVNVGRGPVVDERALVDALAGGRLGGAGLDVFEQEPLPATSPLWELPNVIVTPHACGQTPGNDERALDLFVVNLGRYCRGEPLLNEVTADEVRSPVGA